ncbi:uncharacterized protein LOC135142471 [Zophobas morio]|jgi:pentatricopeptide repeat protein|uniref:uncharacterized protein LOC135142471 n=1 Tax=Zophobas morio TaxID=2755281 RepID=UPI0030838025
MKSYVNAHQFEAAVIKYSLFAKFNVSPSVITYSFLMKHSINASDSFDRALSIYADMLSSGLKPDSVCYSIFFKGCAKFREAEKALVMWEEIRDNVKFTPPMYSGLINALSSRSSLHEKVFDVLLEMKENGVEVNDYILGGILKSCAKSGNVRAAHLAFNNYKNTPNKYHFVGLLNVYGGKIKIIVDDLMNAHLRGEVLHLSMQQLEKQIFLDSSSNLSRSFYDTSVNWKVSELIDISSRRFAQMKSLNISPDVEFINSFLRVYCYSLQYSTALGLFENMFVKYNVEPNVYSYRLLIELCRRVSQPVKAIQLYNELKRSFPDFSKNFLATNICIDVMYAVVLSGAYRYAVKVAEDICSKGISIPPPHTLFQLRSLMIEGNAADEWESIKSLFLKHDKSGKWFVIITQNKENIRKYKPKKLHRMERGFRRRNLKFFGE